MIAKRFFDLAVALSGIVILAPLLILIAVMVRLDSPGPAWFRQTRVGLNQVPFRILKFRTMVVQAEQQGPQITAGGDPRITRSGRLLRKLKLDELPQLFNVLSGEMSLVGPRPEVPAYVEYYPHEMRNLVFSVRPGITDLASVEFRNENELLADTQDPETVYREQILPHKLALCVQYVQQRNLLLDLKILARTIAVIVRH